MKWINLWIKKVCRLYLHRIAFNLIKNNKHQEINENKHDFEMSMPSCRMCCTIMVHRSTNYEIMFLFMDPSDFILLYKLIVIVSN